MTDPNESTGTENQAELAGVVMDGGVEEDPTEAQAPPDTETETEQTEQTGPQYDEEGRPINQAAVQKKIDKAIFEKYEQERKNEELSAKLAEVEKKLQEKEETPGEVVVPPFPDQYDPQFELKKQEYESAIRKQAEIQAQQQFQQQQQEQAIQQQQKKEQQTISELHQGMYSKASELGLEEKELQESDQRVAMFVKDPKLAKFILGMDDSPLVVKHLANSVQDLEQISKMPLEVATAHIASKIAPQARKLKPTITNTPDPLDIPKGKGPGAKKSEYLDGVTFE